MKFMHTHAGNCGRHWAGTHQLITPVALSKPPLPRALRVAHVLAVHDLALDVTLVVRVSEMDVVVIGIAPLQLVPRRLARERHPLPFRPLGDLPNPVRAADEREVDVVARPPLDRVAREAALDPGGVG